MTRPLRIGICAPYDLGRAGGVNTLIRAQATALRRLGHDVLVFGASSAPLREGEVSLGPCVSIVIGNTETGFGIDPRSWWTSKQLLRSAAFDIIHMHEPLMPLPAWFVLWQATVPVVAQFSTYRSEGHRWYPKFRRFFERLMSRVHVRLAVSDAARRTVADHFPGDYEVVPCAIDVARFAAPVPRPPAMPADRPYVLYVGRLEPRKGVDRLVDAMTRVRERVRNAHLVIIGGGPDREAIETRAQDRRVPVLFAGRVSDEDLPAYYQAADVVCSPALADESFGIVLLEAMAAGRPIVASNIAGYAELLEPAGCALLAPPGDVETLANAICTLLQDTQLARTLGRRGADAAKKYDWDVVSRRLVGIYELCLDKLAVER